VINSTFVLAPANRVLFPATIQQTVQARKDEGRVRLAAFGRLGFAMPFSEAQKKQFIALLQSKGWKLREGTIWTASGGLWFNDSHFQEWCPPQMHGIFIQRAARIAAAQK
jgi:hypothetical protein